MVMEQPNWKQILADLVQEFGNINSVAAAVDAHYWSVKQLSTGKTKDPAWSLGDKLLGLHREHCNGQGSKAA